MRDKLLILSVVLLAAIVGYSFYFVGLPFNQRVVYKDSVKLQDFRNIHCAIRNYYYDEKKLPADLKTLKDYQDYQQRHQVNRPWNPCSCYLGEIKITDPDSKAYEYLPQSGHPAKYKLCTDFNVGSEEYKKSYTLYEDWAKDFQQGHYCFEIELEICEDKR